METNEEESFRLFNHRKKLQIIQFIAAFSGFVGLIISIVTPHWYLVYPRIGNRNGYFGLFCGGKVGEDCTVERESVLKFDGTILWPYKGIRAKDLDIVCLFLIISMILTITGCLSPILFFSCKKKWRFQSAVCSSILLAFGAISSFISLCHFENKVAISNTEAGTFKHGSSAILCWFSFAFLLIATVFSLLLLRIECQNPENRNHSEDRRPMNCEYNHYECNPNEHNVL